MELVIRPATFGDIKAITNIYNDAILHTTATFDTEVTCSFLAPIYL